MPKQKQITELVHQPVLLTEVVDLLKPRAGDSYLDLTAGYGGHAQAILNLTKAPSEMVLIDRDEQAIKALKNKFKSSGADIIHSDYLTALRRFKDANLQFDMILADLGVSSPQFDVPERGFSFSQTGPLDMRMDKREELTADEIVNRLSEPELADILIKYGEEPRGRAIARAIIANRPILDTAQLAQIIAKATGWRGRRSKTHPATKGFQALRISVNSELVQLESALPLILDVLAPGGRLAIISFHSLEDRIVKHFLAEFGGRTYDSPLSTLTKKPVTASADELVSNPRSRSAKLRAAAKINKQKG